jgi:hypothetical protein
MWGKALDELGEKVCALYPFICELCHKMGHFNFQCSGHNNDLSFLFLKGNAVGEAPTAILVF